MKKLLSLILLSFTLIMFFALPTNAYYNYKVLKSDSYNIPYLNTSFVPQGLCKTSYVGKTYRLITAYDYNKTKNSRIYIMDSNGNHLRTINLKGTAGCHVGGITEYNGEIWIVSTTKILRISKNTLFKAKNNSTINPNILTNSKIVYKSSTQKNFSFCTSYDNTLWIGSFVESKGIPKAYGYKLINNNLKQVAVMDIPYKCQGMAFVNKTTVFFSVSHEFVNSYIYKYTLNKKTDKNNFSTYTLNMPNFSIEAPSRSQEIYLTNNGNLYVLFESRI